MAIDIIARGMAANAEGGGGGTTAWRDITGKPSTFPPSSHTHTASDITNLDEAIASSSAVSGIEDEVAALSSAVEDMEDMVVIADTTTVGMVKPDGMTITVGQDGTISAVGGSDDNVFIATYGTTTFAELDAAYQAGKVLYVKGYTDGADANQLFPWLNRNIETRHQFGGIIEKNTYIVICCYLVSGETSWYRNTTTHYETITNKEGNSIANPTSTTKYPSSKAVVSYVASQIPDVATSSSTGVVQPDGTTITVDANGVISATGSGGGGNIFIAEEGITSYADIAAAYSSGKQIYVKTSFPSEGDVYLPLSKVSADWYWFSAAADDFTKNTYCYDNNGTTMWGPSYARGIEKTQNKTNDVATNSSDTIQYPSTKGVYDFVATRITSGTSDLIDGVSPLATGAIYCYYTA